MSSFKKLQNLSSEIQKTGEEKPENPYVNKKVETKGYVNPSSGKLSSTEALSAQLLELKREIKDLRQDIATFYSMTLGDGDDQSKMTAAESRGLYYDFRAHPGHIANRISDKINPNTGESNI